MKKTILALALAAGLTSFAGSANAEIIYQSLNQSSHGTLLYVPSTGNDISDAGIQAAGFFGLDNNGNGIEFRNKFSLTMPGMPGIPAMVVNQPEKVVSGNANFMSMTSLLAAGTTISSTSTFLGAFSYDYPSSSPNQQYVGLEAVGKNKEFYYGWASFTDLGGIMTINDAAFNTTAGASITIGGSTAAVPEPSQVAASLLLAAGVAGFVIVKRRNEASAQEALAA